MRSTNPGFVPDSPYYRELPQAWIDFFGAFPRAELHCHLLGTITKSTFEQLVRESGASISQAEIDEFFTRGEKPVGVLRIFRALESQVLKHPRMLKRITLEHLERASANGVRYTELFWNWTGLGRSMDFVDAQAAIAEGLKEGHARFNIVGRQIPSIDREASPEDAEALVAEMTAHRDPSTIGLGIDYRETEHEPENFWKAFRMAKEAGFHITAHAGEFGEHWRNVETAIELLGAERIDHGYTIVDNPLLMAEARQRGVIFAVVPTNSYYLRTLSDADWAERHPIRAMQRAGLRIFPNSDDPTMHAVSCAESWRIMFQYLGFSLEEIRGMVVNSIDAAWVPLATKARWTRHWLDEFDRLARALPPL